MTIYSANCRVIAGAYTDRDNPNTNYGGSNLKIGDVSKSNQFYMRYESFAKFDVTPLSPYAKKHVTDIYFNYYLMQQPKNYTGAELYALDDYFDVNTITFNNAPKSSEYVMAAYRETWYESVKPIGNQRIPIGGASANALYRAMSAYGLKLIGHNGEDHFDTISSTPYFEFQFEDYNPTLTATAPIGGSYVNPAIQNNFAFKFWSLSAIEYSNITSFIFEFRDKSNNAVTTYTAPALINLCEISTANVSVPPNTIVHGKNYQWRVKFTTDDGITTSFSPWADFTTVDVKPDAPQINYPNSSYVDGERPITFLWQHNISTGSAQYAYDLDYKIANGWVPAAAHVISSNQTFTLPDNTFGAGQLVWRVKTYNTDNVASDYSQSATNIVQAKPQAPVISQIIAVPRTVINWQSVGQQAYELVITDSHGEDVEQSGQVFGIAKSHRIVTYLPDGNYTFALRIQNSQGLWSDYATASATIKNSPLDGDDVLLADSVPGGVKLTLSLPGIRGADYLGETYLGEGYLVRAPKHAQGVAYILRDGVPIAQVTNKAYTDYKSVGEHRYTYRVVSEDGNYYDSNTVIATPKLAYGLIAKLSSPQDVLALVCKKDAKPIPTNQLTKVINEHYFSGRSLPVYDVTEHHNSVWSMEYSFLNSADYIKLKQLFLDGETVIVRDRKGYKIVGIIQSLSPAIESNVTTASFTIAECDTNEVIPYV